MLGPLVREMITGFFVLVFAVMWFFSTRYYEKPKQYSIVVYDVFGKPTIIDGLRTEFNTIEVATSYIKEYQKTFSQYAFSLESPIPEIKRKTIFHPILKKD